MIEDADEPEERSTDFRPRKSDVARGFVLTIVEGPDAVRTIPLPQPSRSLIGHGPSCDFKLSDRKVSRRHAALEVEGDRLRLTDLGSSNGTIVNGVTVVEAYLTGNETIRMGATVLRVGRDTESAPVETVSTATSFGYVVGASPEMRRLYPLCERLAASDVPLVIEGETGTGKEVLAESLHNASARANGPFVVFDCTAVPANLMESELFGHERGAFTGAGTTRKGMFEQADGGTLLIDEIGDLDLSLQPKLLRAVERREIRRIGGDRAIRVDVRLLSATRRDLDREVLAGRFRDDLFHRLAVTRIELPPLRKRKGDVRELAKVFAREFDREVPDEILARWEDESWPGNVRELRNAVARWVTLGDFVAELAAVHEEAAPEVPPAATNDLIAHVLSLHLPLTQARQRIIDSFERRYIEEMLAQNGGHVGRAAAASGIGRRYFQMLLARRS